MGVLYSEEKLPVITLGILGALIMIASLTIESNHERYIRIFGGSMFFMGTLLIPDYFVSSNKKTENK